MKVGGHRIKIKSAKFSDLDGFGSHRRRDGIIEVATDTADDQQRATVVHEILHACCAESGLRQKLGVGKPGIDEEDVVQAIEPLLFQVLNDNPDIVRFICKK